MFAKDSVIDKIRLLLAHAEGKKTTSPLEAQEFARKATELLQQYNLDMADVTQTEENTEEIGGELFDLSTGKFQVSLIHVLAKANFCFIIKHGNDQVYLIGKPFNVETVKSIYANVVWQWKHASNLACREYTRDFKARNGGLNPDSFGSDYSRSTFTKSWWLGAVNGLSTVLNKQTQDFRQSAKGNALMVVNDSALKWWAYDNIPNIRQGRKSKIRKYNGEGYQQGFTYGQNTQLVRGQVNSGQLRLHA